MPIFKPDYEWQKKLIFQLVSKNNGPIRIRPQELHLVPHNWLDYEVVAWHDHDTDEFVVTLEKKAHIG